MIKILFLFLLVFAVAIPLRGQSPQALNYQAIARDPQGQPMSNQPVQVVFSILDGSVNGIPIYIEKQNATTNAFGIFILAIGLGNPQIGTFSGINWSSGTKFLKVENII